MSSRTNPILTDSRSRPIPQYYDPNLDEYRPYVGFEPETVVVNATADGDNTIVAADPLRKIRVIAYALRGSSAAAFTAKSAATALATFTLASGERIVYVGSHDVPAFETEINEALIFTNAAGLDVVGHLTIVRVPETYS